VNELLAGFLFVIGGMTALVAGTLGLLFLLYVIGKAASKKRPR
jgi:hypothetical protein